MEKYNISRSGYHSKFFEILRLPRKVTLQLHQILRLPRKVTLIIDPCHTWNAIYNARSNRCHHQILRLPGRMIAEHVSEGNLVKADETSFTMHGQSETVPRMIRAWTRQSATRLATEVNFCARQQAFCIEKYNIWRSGYHSKFPEKLRLPRKVTLELNDILRLPREVTLGLHQILRLPWKSLILVTYETLFTMRGATGVIVQPHQIFCTSHEKWLSNMWEKFGESRWNVIYNARPIRDRSENDPWTRQSATRLATEVTFRAHHEHFVVKCPDYHSKFHEILRLPRKVTFELHDILRLPREVTLGLHQIYCACHEKWLGSVYYYSTLLVLDSTFTGFYYYLTLLLLHSSITWLYFYLILLLLNSTITWLFYYLTLLLFDSSIIWLYYYLTLLLLDSTIAWLYCYLTLLLLDSTIT